MVSSVVIVFVLCYVSNVSFDVFMSISRVMKLWFIGCCVGLVCVGLCCRLSYRRLVGLISRLILLMVLSSMGRFRNVYGVCRFSV